MGRKERLAKESTYIHQLEMGKGRNSRASSSTLKKKSFNIVLGDYSRRRERLWGE